MFIIIWGYAMKVTNSQRLSYHLMDENDIDSLFELDQDPAVMKYINGGKPNSREEIIKTYIPRMESYTNADKGWGLWGVNITENDEFIGWILVRPMEFFSDNPKYNDLEMGWRFMQKSWGKGYGTEAASHILQALIDNKSATQYSAIALSENTASFAIMKKLGMKFVKKAINKDPLGDMLVEYYTLKL